MNAWARWNVGLILIVAVCLAMSGVHFVHAEDATTTTDNSATSTAETASTTPDAAPAPTPAPIPPHKATQAEIKKLVEAKFADAPAMIAIAKCESNFRQFTDAGNVLHGYGSMIGVFQFSDSVHRAAALRHGFDIDTVDGNLGYARYIYDKQGTDPWISSFSCWGTAAKKTALQSASSGSNSDSLTADLSFGMTDPQVLTVQKILNAKGFTVSETGPGSSGNETTMFGSLTRAAVRKFQCAKLSICSGDEYSTGYGFINAETRAALLADADSSKISNSGSAKTKETSKSSNSNQAASATQSAAAAQTDQSVEEQIAALWKIIELLQAQIALLLQRQ